jgi:hypothetical protein
LAACLHDGSKRAGDEAAVVATAVVGWADAGFFINNNLPDPLTVVHELVKCTLLLKLFIVVCCMDAAIDADVGVVVLLG